MGMMLEIRHFLPTMTTKPVDFLLLNMALHAIRTTGANAHEQKSILFKQ